MFAHLVPFSAHRPDAVHQPDTITLTLPGLYGVPLYFYTSCPLDNILYIGAHHPCAPLESAEKNTPLCVQIILLLWGGHPLSS